MFRNKKHFYLFMTLVLTVISSIGYKVQSSAEIILEEDKLYDVARVVDGDTLRLVVERKNVAVRLLGIDTPESVHPSKEPECFGKEASDYLSRLVENKKVFVKMNKDREAKDRYGRFLVYLYTEQGLFVNEKMVEDGYAKEYTYGKPYSFQLAFRQAQNEATVMKAGLWGKCNLTLP